MTSPFQVDRILSCATLATSSVLLGTLAVPLLPFKEIAIGGVVSTAYATIVDQSTEEKSTLYKIFAITSSLGLGSLLLPSISSHLSKWTGVVISLKGALFMSTIVTILKLATMTLRSFELIQKVNCAKEAESLMTIHLYPLHEHYQNNRDAFRMLDLRTQTVLNKRFFDLGLKLLPMTKFSEIGTGFTKEEATFLGNHIDPSLLNQKERLLVVQTIIETLKGPNSFKATIGAKELNRVEDVKTLFTIELPPLYFSYQNNRDAFKILDLHTQVILNKRFFTEVGLNPIPITGFSKIGRGFTREEIELLGSQVNLSLLNQKQREEVLLLLYQNDQPIPKNNLNQQDFTLILSRQKLSLEKLRWIHKAYSLSKDFPENLEERIHYARSFCRANLPPPNDFFYLPLEDIKSLSFESISTLGPHVIPWIFNSYAKHLTDWKKLPLKTQFQLNQLFNKYLKRSLYLYPKASECFITHELIKALYLQYHNNKPLWYLLPKRLQNALNHIFLKQIPSCALPLPTLDSVPSIHVPLILEYLKKYPEHHQSLNHKQQVEFANRCQKLSLPLTPDLKHKKSNHDSKSILSLFLIMGLAVLYFRYRENLPN